MFNVLVGSASGTGIDDSEQGCRSVPGELLLVILSVVVFACLIKVITIALCPVQSKIFLSFGQGSDMEIQAGLSCFDAVHVFYYYIGVFS